MSVLNGVIMEEYERLSRIITKVQKEINELPKGYISEKRINGKVYHYLQFREGEKVKSVYLKADKVESYRVLIAHRNELIINLKGLQEDKKRLERMLE